MPEALRSLLDRLGGRAASADPGGFGQGAPGNVKAGEVKAGEVKAGEVEAATATSTQRPPSHPGLDRPRPSGSAQGLEVRDLSVHFGGVKAVQQVSLTAPAGIITGLLGPNGAGKTTTFNACSGLRRPTAGHVLLHGTDVTRYGAAERARRGLGRTFQRTELFNSLTVWQNIAIGREAPMAGRNPLAQLAGSRSTSRLVAAAAAEAMALTGTTALARTQAGLLSVGQRRLVELARVLAGPFDMLLLDEPSSGLDAHETEQFGQVLETVVANRGCGILLVEHDMTLVRQVCDRVYVLDFGELIFTGTAAEMHQSNQVRAAYLGDLPTAAAAAGDDQSLVSGE